MFVVSEHRPCSPPFLSLQSHWEGASLVERGCNFKLLPENGKVASLVTSQETASLLTPCLLCLLVETSSASTWIFYLTIYRSFPLFLYVQTNIHPTARRSQMRWKSLRVEIQCRAIGPHRKKNWWNMTTTTVVRQVTSKPYGGIERKSDVFSPRLESKRTFMWMVPAKGLAAALPWLRLAKRRTMAMTSDKRVKEKRGEFFCNHGEGKADFCESLRGGRRFSEGFVTYLPTSGWKGQSAK